MIQNTITVLKKAILFTILSGSALIAVNAQSKSVKFFGSYNYGMGKLTAKVNSALGYPYEEEIKKLTSGTINQFELGVNYHSFGLGFIHNSYAADASTNYVNADVNYDTYFENGTLKDQLNLRFNGIELLYKIPVLNNRADITGKIGAGYQSYTIEKDFNLLGTFPSHNNYSLTGTKFTPLTGVEINFQIWKMISAGLETSFIPGNYTRLKNKQITDYIYADNVTRLSTGLKIKIIL